jgi:hypothetical protein
LHTGSNNPYRSRLARENRIPDAQAIHRRLIAARHETTVLPVQISMDKSVPECK